ncbi:2,3-diaminopropionate biosynthesis protein SbnB [Parvibium lacunae]|uniref:2,3-diaminopropionate biosynthesis protein SbnB n=1 Tax=Parvibium lacunae TaxID=1888893 RepID=A0A368L0U2_9BURK|nr:2,3-diaminopropionate biosynthesis protein SbnB [Parvibium lacunae]RCS57017.1 2,3-diaminopropionate biosynthesis protein SbnB [Parvibium lacunae]
MSNAITLLTAADVARQLVGRERELIELAGQAYCTHARGESRLPQSEYLRFPGMERERIIPKAGYLGGAHPIAGIKWIGSFPDNVQRGLPRASAVMILNSVETGRPTTIMEGSLISGQRTAASAALAARLLHDGPQIACLGLIGCGPINAETLRFIRADLKPIARLCLFDLDPNRMAEAATAIRHSGFNGEITQAHDITTVLSQADLISFATSAVTPSVTTLAQCQPNATVLHISLRDLAPAAILSADNIVDDIDHVLQANTSLHVTEQAEGHRRFIRGTLADIVEGRLPARVAGQISVFSPFGLAALDLAFAEFVQRHCLAAGSGLTVPDFLP